MNKIILIIAIAVAIIIGGGYYLIQSNPKVKAQAEKLGIIDAPPRVAVPPVHNSVFMIFDPSGSGNSSFRQSHVPQGRVFLHVADYVSPARLSISGSDCFLTFSASCAASLFLTSHHNPCPHHESRDQATLWLCGTRQNCCRKSFS